MVLERKLYVGIPRGSLNRPEPNRGDTKLLLETAGWRLEGYDHKNEKGYYPAVIEGDKEVQFITLRPRDMPFLLDREALDLAICGRDKVIEWEYGSKIQRENTLEETMRELEKKLKREPRKIEKRYHQSFKKWREKFEKKFNDVSSYIWFEYYERWCFSRYLKSARGISIFNPTSEDFRELRRETEEWEGRPQAPKNTILINLNSNELKELVNLGYGKAGLYFITLERLAEDFRKRNNREVQFEDFLEVYRLICMTEYPNITYVQFAQHAPQDILRKITTQEKESPLIGANKWPIQIIESRANEISLSLINAQLTLECVVSGDSLRENNLVRLGESVLRSYAALYRPEKIDGVIPAFYNLGRSIDLNSVSPLYHATGWRPEMIEKARRKGDSAWCEAKIQELTEKLRGAAQKLGWIN